MRPVRMFGALLVALTLAGCGESEAPLAPTDQQDELLDSNGGANRIVLELSGPAHFTRTVGTVTALTIFRFHATQKANGDTRGRYFYNFQAAGFSVKGPITCMTRNGNQVWVGGTVTSMESADPEDQSLVGLDMWWRSIDNGHGRLAPPDSTTGLGFGFAGSTITTESWCRDQPAVLIMREVEKGDVRLKSR